MDKRERLFSLLKNEALFRGFVKLSSGKISDFYIDVRRVSLTAEGLYLISSLIWENIKGEDISAIGGPTLGADPLVSGVCIFAHNAGKNLKGFLIRKSPKEHGRHQLIEGKELVSGERVIIMDDVATSGSSLINSLKILQKEKVNVVKAIVVVDREEGAKENLLKLGCPLVSLFTRSDFFRDV